MIDGRLFLAITNEKKVLAIKSWEDTNMEMFSPDSCLVLDKDGNVFGRKVIDCTLLHPGVCMG